MSSKELDNKAYDLYEHFRPSVPAGMKGWGKKGELNLDYIVALAADHPSKSKPNNKDELNSNNNNNNNNNENVSKKRRIEQA